MGQPLKAAELHRPLHVLVVDDNLDQVRSLAWLVKDCGDCADYAVSGMVALEMAQRLKPDVLILDVFLPDTSGFELVRQLRRNPELKDVYVIAVSGHGVEASEAAVNGFDELLRKPVHFSEVAAALSRARLRKGRS